jgi:8-oxo-dGTP pyrophosphatase MutT (NUDIX family)
MQPCTPKSRHRRCCWLDGRWEERPGARGIPRPRRGAGSARGEVRRIVQGGGQGGSGAVPWPRRRPVLRARLVILRGAPGAAEVLLALHRHAGREPFWCFPGGGCEPGETLEAAATREALEETGLRVVLEGICHIQDRPQADAIDVFFRAHPAGGALPALGVDPERPAGERPVLEALRWCRLGELHGLRVLPRGLAARLAAGSTVFGQPLPLPETVEAP